MERCELLDKCRFFSTYGNNQEVVKHDWLKCYCENSINSEQCERKAIRKLTGSPPTDNMAPTGRML